ncbi:MAG: FmdB family zinc ribbon protein [Anaerolineae bacterium]
MTIAFHLCPRKWIRALFYNQLTSVPSAFSLYSSVVPAVVQFLTSDASGLEWTLLLQRRSVTMPLYEYVCPACDRPFDMLRPFSKADSPAECPGCHEVNGKRAISRFAAHVHGSDGSSHSVAGGSACGGCERGSCAGCQH